ncbi:uncharacterized protein LOC110450234 [Mizuhopecten yessoensis]|uniref:SEFIR domain-containing protein n=1 Tax=Mizuhopecten yessoensis TaxID=6573 RepID=A0A210QP78_MIZYE|nr:uncharacterized protein LOC110450234 [Mizuhopecten yessoensis]XP_021353294.1 uncharacterized protein LOC110450234 [Mizuhopecten yessoensis]XP_021353295.1 uncharacterized protein LOC110450234 [Mizuhopecten yessoensis]XP_021353296.1 uncharacterized protein LOC110450234 [Mizuhopecten yessoensis]OWF50536.1 hypothetical protein KP79_PYT18251 [Mizuhopecten yessoensis]
MEKKDKFRGIPLIHLPVAQQIRLANRLDQDDGSGKDYFVFAQTLEKMCGFKFGIAEYNALKVLRSVPHASPTLLLFNRYYIPNPNITLELVYMVLQEMELEDCTAVLEESFPEIEQRYKSGECRPFDGNLNGQNEHRCRCESCRQHDSTECRTFSSANTLHHCHLPNSNGKTARTTCRSQREPLEFSSLHCPVSNTSSEHPRHQSLHPNLESVARPPFAFPPVHHSQQNNHQAVHQNEYSMLLHNQDTLNIRQRNTPSQGGQNWIRRGPQMSTSTLQLPFYQGSSLKTPVTQAYTQPGPETGAIPKQLREYSSYPDDSPLSPLEKQNRADSRQGLHRRNSSPHNYPSAKCQNEALTLQNNPKEYNRHPSHVNDLGKDNVKQFWPDSTNQCTCRTDVRVQLSAVAPSRYQNGGISSPIPYTQHEFLPPSPIDSEDDESEQTKLLEVVGSFPSHCTCPSQNSVANSRQSSTKSDAERRYSNPQESWSSSNNCSEVLRVKRSSSDEELKRNDLSPRGSVIPHNNPRQIKLFLTFADDSERHLEEVLTLGSQLKDIGFIVKCDMFNQTIQKLISQPNTNENRSSMQQFFSNTNDWLDYQVQNADYLVFCISPRYYQYVRPQEQIYGSGNIPANSVRSAHVAAGGAQPNNCHLHTKYIYNQACSEHFNALTQNKRFYPVLFPNSGATQYHIPNIFKSTLIFNYPDPNSSLLTFLANRLNQ